MRYVPGKTANTRDEAERVRRWADNMTVDSFRLVKRYAAPSRPLDGDVVYADGTTWNPGSGEGAYIYYSSTWNFLG